MNLIKNSLKISQENEKKSKEELKVVWDNLQEKEIEIKKLNKDNSALSEFIKQNEKLKNKNTKLIDENNNLKKDVLNLNFKVDEILADNVIIFFIIFNI